MSQRQMIRCSKAASLVLFIMTFIVVFSTAGSGGATGSDGGDGSGGEDGGGGGEIIFVFTDASDIEDKCSELVEENFFEDDTTPFATCTDDQFGLFCDQEGTVRVVDCAVVVGSCNCERLRPMTISRAFEICGSDDEPAVCIPTNLDL